MDIFEKMKLEEVRKIKELDEKTLLEKLRKYRERIDYEKRVQYDNGRMDGYVDGFKDGFKWGMIEARRTFLEWFTEIISEKDLPKLLKRSKIKKKKTK